MTADLRSLWKRGDSFWSDHALSMALALVATVLYMLTLTNGAYFTRDTLLYAQAVEDGWGTFHAQHLAYVPLGQLFYTIWTVLGYTGRALLPLQVLSVIVGALNVGLVHSSLRRIVSRPAALATTALFALSYGSWRYAVEANPYPMTMTGLLLVLMLLAARERRSLSWAILAGAATALASLFTLSGALLAPAVLVTFWRMPSGHSGRAEKARLSIAYMLALLAIVGSAYIAVAVGTEGVRTSSDLMRYLTRFIRGSSGWLGTGGALSWRSFAKAVPGFANIFVGEVPFLRWMQSSARGWETLFAVSPAAVLVEKGATSVPIPGDVTLALIVSSAVFITLGIGTIWLLRRWDRIRASNPYLVDMMTVWFVSFSVGALIWLPENVHYWLPNLIPVCVVGAIAYSVELQMHRKRNSDIHSAWAVFLLGLTTANLVGSILPLRVPRPNPYHAMVLSFEHEVESGAAVIVLGAGEYRQAPTYLKYYIGCDAMSVRRMFIAPDDRRRGDYRDALMEMIETALKDGAGAYALSDLFDSELGYAQLTSWGHYEKSKIANEIESLLVPWVLHPVAWHGDRLTLYEMLPARQASIEPAETREK